MNYKAVAIMLMVFVVSSCAPKRAVRPPETPAPTPAATLKLPEVEPKKETPGEKKAGEGKTGAPAPVEKSQEEQYVMLNFENTDVETVVATICEMLKINYIIAPGVSGKITIQSYNKIPMSELFATFQTILEVNGFTAVKYGSFYRIVPIDTAKQQPVPVTTGKAPVIPKDQSFVTQEVPLEYVKAGDVANIVRNLMPRGTDIIVYEPSNMLIITAPPAGMLKFLKILEAIDIPATERDTVRTFVYYVENGEAKKLMDILKSIYVNKKGEGAPVRTTGPAPSPVPPVPAGQSTRTRIQRPPTPTPAGASVQEGLAAEIEGEPQIEAYEDINALLIKTTPRGYLSMLETIKKLDVQPKQVLIEVLIAEITLDNSTQFGIEWLLKSSVQTSNRDYDFDLIGGFTDKNTGSLQYNTDTNRFQLPSNADKILTQPVNAFANILAPRKFDMLITAAASSGRLNVIASPHILALDNKEAKIEIADEVPVATAITQPIATTGTTVNATSQVQFKLAGTILTVTPHINDKKQVTLKLVQEVSDIGKTFPIGGQDYQGFTTRKATTTAIVQDGHTLVLGGIINETKQTTHNGIPFLSDIPVLGYLFGSTTNTHTRKELILMVTPRVIGNYEEADDLTQELKNRVKGIKERIERKERDEGNGGKVPEERAEAPSPPAYTGKPSD
jgi:type II secretory pathway component GspD/PulD (secretin)